MNQFLTNRLAAFTLALLSYHGIASEPPDLKHLARTSERTAERLETAAAAWTTHFRLSEHAHIDVKVVRQGRRRSWSFAEVVQGSRQKICDIVQSDDVWHVMAKGQRLKCRPYEAELRFPGAYGFLAFAELRYFAGEQELTAADFEKEDRGLLTFRVRPTGELRRTLENALAELNKLNAAELTLEQRKTTKDKMALVREQLTNGAPIIIDQQTGIVLETKVQAMTVSFEGFRWLDRVPPEAFVLPNGVAWDDQTRPWSGSDFDHCVLVARDPLFAPGGAPLSLDTYVLNVKSGGLRRVPFHGMTSMPGGFGASRREAFVAGMDANGRAGLTRIDLATGENKAVTSGWLSGGPLLMGEISPDGQYALGFTPLLSNMEVEVQIVNLRNGSAKTIRKTGRLGGPASWLPDGDGVILKRFEPVDDPKQIEPRVLCRLDLDGTLRDLRPGDSPLVLRKSRKILYEESESRLWHTCDLDGSNPKLYADGLPSHGEPALSPDERQILFTRFNKGSSPQLMLFDFGKSNGVPATRAPGYTGKPVWR